MSKNENGGSGLNGACTLKEIRKTYGRKVANAISRAIPNPRPAKVGELEGEEYYTGREIEDVMYQMGLC